MGAYASFGILLAGSMALQVDTTKAVSSADTEAVVHHLRSALTKQTGQLTLPVVPVNGAKDQSS